MGFAHRNKGFTGVCYLAQAMATTTTSADTIDPTPIMIVGKGKYDGGKNKTYIVSAITTIPRMMDA
jgi:hypothetical protein